MRVWESDVSLKVLNNNNYGWFYKRHAMAWRKCGSAGRQMPIDSDRSLHRRQGLFFYNRTYFLVVDRHRPANSVKSATTSRSTAKKNWANQGQFVKTHSDEWSNCTFVGFPRLLSGRSESVRNSYVLVTFIKKLLLNISKCTLHLNNERREFSS